MLKKAFTLAEVLITLAIIGVVATTTLPALNSNISERQGITGLKKGVNTLTNAVSQNVILNGIDYYTTTSEEVGNPDDLNSFFGIIANNTYVNYSQTGPAKYLDASELYAIFLNDGSSIIYSPKDSIRDSRTVQNGVDSTVGFTIYYDVNGLKGPNLLSNCRGSAKLEVKNPYSSPPIGEACANKSKRVIKDIFKLKAQATTVVPDDPSSSWAMEQ